MNITLISSTEYGHECSSWAAPVSAACSTLDDRAPSSSVQDAEDFERHDTIPAPPWLGDPEELSER